MGLMWKVGVGAVLGGLAGLALYWVIHSLIDVIIPDDAFDLWFDDDEDLW